MAKRGAEEQITKDSHFSQSDNENNPKLTLASTEVLAKRKIIQPRGRKFALQSVPSAHSSSSSAQEVAAKIKALNNKFIEKIQEANKKDGVPDFRLTAEQYLKYYAEIDQSSPITGPTKSDTTSANPFSGFTRQDKPKPIEPQTTTREVEQKVSASSSDDEVSSSVPIQGPTFKFSGHTANTKSPFAFGKKPVKPSSDSDESEVEIKGPTFTFGKKIEDPVFKFSKPAVSDARAASNPFNASSTRQGVGSSESSTTQQLINATSSEGSFPKSAFGSMPLSTNSKNAPFTGSLFTSNSFNASEAQEEKGNEEESDVHFEPVATLANAEVDATTGEESESVAFQKRAKIMILDTENKENPYKNVGVGDLKVLKSPEGMSRVLVRADGGLRVLLNTSLIKAMTYSTMGNGSLVRVPQAQPDQSLKTYVIKVKTPADGQELCSILNELKSDVR